MNTIVSFAWLSACLAVWSAGELERSAAFVGCLFMVISGMMRAGCSRCCPAQWLTTRSEQTRMSTPRNPQYWLAKKAHRKTGYPVATIAYYGPDATFASKVVVGIIVSERDDEVAVLNKWVAAETDVRVDPAINQQILDFIEHHHVHRVAMVDRLIGCPHEEGIDYPEGEACPHCPYWADRDRWTGEVLS